MTHTIVNDEKEIGEIIRESFDADDSLMNYVLPATRSEAIENIVSLNILACENGSDFYKLESNSGALIGYANIIAAGNTLYSFGIKISERSEENKKSFIRVIEEIIQSEEIVCVLNDKNTRAIKFLEMNGYENQKVVVLKKIRCQQVD